MAGDEYFHKAAAPIFSYMLPLYDRMLIKYSDKQKIVSAVITNVHIMLEKINRDKNLTSDSAKCFGRTYTSRFLYDVLGKKLLSSWTVKLVHCEF